MKTLFVVLFIVLGLGLVTGGSYISYYNLGAQNDALLKAKYDNMQNVLAQYSLKVTEAAQVPQMYTKDLAEVAKAAIGGRYGESGSKATFQWIQEHNPNVDPSVFVKIQQIIEGGRDNFQNEQTQFIDIKRSYKVQLTQFWSGLWLHLAGYPKISLDDYKLISSDHASETFKTGIDKGIKLTQ